MANREFSAGAGDRLIPFAAAAGIKFMLYTLALVLIILWLLGFVSSYTMGGFIHILLVVAIVLILVRLIQGRRV